MKFKTKEPILGYKKGTTVKLFDNKGELKTYLIINSKGVSTGEFLYAREKQMERIEE